MEGTIGEIRLFAADFAPKNWAFCRGQLLNINTNQALFSILGTTYGGNGQTTFALPNFASRVAVGTPGGIQNGGITGVTLGATAGTETYTLTINETPSHTHTAIISQSSPMVPSGNLALQGTADPSTLPTPQGNLLGADDGGGALAVYAPASGATVNMSSRAVSSNLTLGTPTVTFANAGSGLAHYNIQPYLAVSYIICLLGIYPSRN